MRVGDREVRAAPKLPGPVSVLRLGKTQQRAEQPALAGDAIEATAFEALGERPEGRSRDCG